MDNSGDWEIPARLRPKSGDLGFDLDTALAALVLLRAEVPEDAFTAPVLGTERIGSGVAIRADGIVLTIGYLITEAQTIWLTTADGRAVAGHALAYDQQTGFGLVQALGPLGVPAMACGLSGQCRTGDAIVLASYGGRRHALCAKVEAKREFAGYWEYLLDEAIFTVPAHPHWSGAALIDRNGQLLGIGSLLVQERQDGQEVAGNMFVPIDLLGPILNDLLTRGQVNRPARPWLGVYATDTGGQVVVGGVAPGGPGDRAGVESGDMILEIAGEPVMRLAEMYRAVWRLGGPKVAIPLTLARGRKLVSATIQAADRNDFLKKPGLH
jgi:S1-C subfamily serine protease